jgi:hypothetical protein
MNSALLDEAIPPFMFLHGIDEVGELIVEP